MKYELIINEFIELKKEQLNYIDSIARLAKNTNLSESEKLLIYRRLFEYQDKLIDVINKLRNAIIEMPKQTNKSIIEFDLDKDFLSSVKFRDTEYKRIVFKSLGIDYTSLKFKLSVNDLIYNHRFYTKGIFELILHKQKLIDKPIYVYCGLYDSAEDCVGPCFGEPDDYMYANYVNIWDDHDVIEIKRRNQQEFEQDNRIIYLQEYVYYLEISDIFKEALLNSNNASIDDCIKETVKRLNELNSIRSPEYKEKVLLDRINSIYKLVKGEYIKQEILYSGEFLDLIKETYRLANSKIVEKEKVRKNNGKNAVIVIALTKDKEYIITFQNRIRNTTIAEFPSGYIENDEDPIMTAKRELEEETGYVTDDLFVIDKAYTSPGIDNSITYIVIANNCVKTDLKKDNSTELVNYGLFSELELKYLVDKNIMSGAMNKLAYYNLICNVDDCSILYIDSNKRVYKMPKKESELKL